MTPGEWIDAPTAEQFVEGSRIAFRQFLADQGLPEEAETITGQGLDAWKVWEAAMKELYRTLLILQLENNVLQVEKRDLLLLSQRSKSRKRFPKITI